MDESTLQIIVFGILLLAFVGIAKWIEFRIADEDEDRSTKADDH